MPDNAYWQAVKSPQVVAIELRDQPRHTIETPQNTLLPPSLVDVIARIAPTRLPLAMAPQDRPHVIKQALAQVGAFEVLRRLGVAHRREGHRARLFCPFHNERTPSATFAIGPEGTLRLTCFGACQRSWDALDLVAQVHRLEASRDFVATLHHAAALAGLDLASLGAPPSTRDLAPRSLPAPTPPPPTAQVLSLWEACRPVEEDDEVCTLLGRRAIDPRAVDVRDLARALPVDTPLPRWAALGSRPWTATGHRLLVPVFDARGTLRSLRARLVAETESGRTPKAAVPQGYSVGGLVMACSTARALLAAGQPPLASAGPGTAPPFDAIVAEGEPDFLTWATRVPEASRPTTAVFGIFAHAWTEDHAARLPDGCRVAVRTHRDAAGARYAAYIRHTLTSRLAAGTVRVFVPKDVPHAETPR